MKSFNSIKALDDFEKTKSLLEDLLIVFKDSGYKCSEIYKRYIINGIELNKDNVHYVDVKFNTYTKCSFDVRCDIDKMDVNTYYSIDTLPVKKELELIESVSKHIKNAKFRFKSSIGISVPYEYTHDESICVANIMCMYKLFNSRGYGFFWDLIKMRFGVIVSMSLSKNNKIQNEDQEMGAVLKFVNDTNPEYLDYFNCDEGVFGKEKAIIFTPKQYKNG